MSCQAPVTGFPASVWDDVVNLAETGTVARHANWRALVGVRVEQRDLADAVHGLCAVYGRQPGLIDTALASRAQPAAHDWLEAASAAFADERAYLARLTAAAGPLPSTPGQAASENAFAAQRRALDMLARSDRSGCATGAVAALMLDWHATRRVLGRAAERFGIAPAPQHLPDAIETAAIVATLGDSPATERAIGFGARQLFAQQRALWELLEARRSARDRL